MSHHANEFKLVLAVLVVGLFAITLALLFSSIDAEAGGTGDYPPPASGHWYINNPTNVWSEAIEIKGNVYVYAPLTMNLVNLTMNGSYNNHRYFTVYTTGSLTFTNGNITASNPSYHYRFRLYNTTVIRNSDLSEAYYGIEVYTKEFTITDSRIFNMWTYGVRMYLWYTLKGNVLIKGNEFVSNRNYGIYVYQYASVNRVDFNAVMTGDIAIQQNTFSDNLGGGIYIYRYMYAWYSYEEKMFTNLTIEGNSMIENRGYAIYVYTYLYNYQGGDDGKITYKGSINVNNNTVKDNSGYYAVYYRNAISIYYGSDALIDSDVNMVGNVITGNKGTYAVYFYNSIYEYYGRDARVRIDLRMEANNISNNGGHAVFIDSYSNTNHGTEGICTNDGDIVVKDNVIQNNQGSGIYLYRIAYASYAASCSITGNTTFEGNDIRNNQGYGGCYLYTYCQKNRGVSDASAKIRGDVKFLNNKFIGNTGYGAYILRYTRSYYGGDSEIVGDVLFQGNTFSKNTGYGGYMFYDAYKSYGATTATASVISNATFKSNTMSSNSGWHGFYYYKRSRCYYSNYSTLNGTVTAEGNTIEDNKGYGIYIYAYSYNYQGALGDSFISGDIWVRDNTIRRNNGGGVYLYCYSSSFRAKSADIYQNITFFNNVVTNNGYSGFVVSVGAYSNRAIGGDTHVVGDIIYTENKVNANLYNGIYFNRYATADYTSSTGVLVQGDMHLENNTANANYNYGIYINNYVRNTQAGLAGRSIIRSDYIVRNNTVRDNLYWAALYLRRAVSAYYTGNAELDSDMLFEDNTIYGNRGTGVYLLDECDQYFYGGSGVPDRGQFALKGRLNIVRNSITTNAGTGLHVNSTIDAAVRIIEPAPVIANNVISYNGGDFGFYCDLRDITKSITIEDNAMEHNQVQYVALVSNSGTAPDIVIRNNRIRHNDVAHTTFGLVIGQGDYNATVVGNNISYNDCSEFALALVSTGQVTIEGNFLVGNVNATDEIIVLGNANTSVVKIEDNIVRGNSGNGINVRTLGELTVESNEVRGNRGTGIIATTDISAEVIEAEITIKDNDVQGNDGNGIWSISLNTLEVHDNDIIGNGMAGIRVSAMQLLPDLKDNVIDGNKWGVYLSGDNLAPLTTTYTFQDLTITDSTSEGLYIEDLRVQLRSSTIIGSAEADLAVRRGFIDCYSTSVGYASGHVYESGHIRVWWRVDIDVRWQSGVPVPGAHVTLASQQDSKVYREFDTDENGHIDHFNIEEWSMVNSAVNMWSPYACTAEKRTESSTQVETVNRSRNILLILVDTHLPWVTIDEPMEGALLNYSLVRVLGSASDTGSGLVMVRYRMDTGQWNELGTGPAFSKLLGLEDGPHTITVQAEDMAGMLGNATVNLTIDTVLPRLMVVKPSEGDLTNVSLQPVEGRVMEPDLEVTVNRDPMTIDENGAFKTTIRLYEGPNVVRVWAKDLAGNQRLILINLTLDTIPPVLTVDHPPNGHLTRHPEVTVSGRSEPGANVTIGGAHTTVYPGGTFDLSITLVEGENRLSITARDAAGNPNTVFLLVRLDTQPPHLTIEEPEEGLLTRLDRLRVVGAVAQEEGIVLSVGGSFVLPVGGRYNYTVDLVEGENVITVTARDAAGNEAEVNRAVIRRTTPPPLTITRPAHDYIQTSKVRYVIEGSTAPDVTLMIAGELAEVTVSGNFSHEVSLQSGDNAIAISASDILGNVAEMVRHIILDIEPPLLTIENPYSGYSTDHPSVNVSGRTEVGAVVSVDGEEVPINDQGRFHLLVDLEMGEQDILVIATDPAGNTREAALDVTRTEPTRPPEPLEEPRTASAGIAIGILVVLIAIGAAVGYLLVMKRRRDSERL